ncbi:MAG: hypothetical protein KIT63_02530 [Rhodoferax sp.]|nr:hypothetical protein [Rhodoferax sp.]
MGKKVSTNRFFQALKSIPMPGGSQLKFLSAHYSATGRALTATKLAEAAGYTKWHALNLQYGLLGKRIAQALNHPDAHLGLLVDFSGPGSVTNEQWILFMKPEFADALAKAGWVK